MNKTIIDLRYSKDLTKFPDGSLKFTANIAKCAYVEVITSLRSSDDILALALVKDVLDRLSFKPVITLSINYMMYQQDDRLFAHNESFGLKIIANFINSLNFDHVYIFHPHSDKVEFINNCVILDNTGFIELALSIINQKDLVWVIPDAGAFKTQFKQIEKLKYPKFITCLKSRDHKSGDLTTIVTTDDLQGADCFIVDDICLGGRTFLAIANELKKKNCGKLYLIVSHGIFNYGTEQLETVFEKIFTTDSICKLNSTDKLVVYAR